MRSLAVIITLQKHLLLPGVVLAPAVWGARGPQRGAGHQKNLVGYMYKFAVFDIKLAYNH